MDLYRYFHPHHNPRLQKIPMRMQELAELEQAAIELRNAVKRAEIRTRHASTGNLRDDSFAELLAALDFVVDSFAEITHGHPGDDYETMMQLLHERKEAPGWENWAKLLQQRLTISNVFHEAKTGSDGQDPLKNFSQR